MSSVVIETSDGKGVRTVNPFPSENIFVTEILRGNSFKSISEPFIVTAGSIVDAIFETNEKHILVQTSKLKFIDESNQPINMTVQSYDDAELDVIGTKSQDQVYNLRGDSTTQSTLFIYDDTTTVDLTNARKIPFYLKVEDEKKSITEDALTDTAYIIKPNTINVARFDNSLGGGNVTVVFSTSWVELDL